MKIDIRLTDAPKPKPDPENLPFGRIFTDHMFVMDYRDGAWRNARIVPFGPLSVSPAAIVFHYGMEVFEGLKAYRTPTGGIQLFRPEENIKRLNSSCERLCLPALDVADVVEAMKKLVSIERDWVPDAPETSLYIRPFVMAVDENLSLHGCNEFLFLMILSPVGAYHKAGLSPVTIMIENEDVRAVRGGTGCVKCGGNYAGAMRASTRAAQMGYNDVLWLDGVERKYVEEVGSMNVMFKIAGKVVTPQLRGSVLPGITRKSCIDLMRRWGVTAEERLVSAEELLKASEDGTLEEAWGCGTAAVISPIGTLVCGGKEYPVGNGETGDFARRLHAELTGIQWGRLPDPFGWIVPVE